MKSEADEYRLGTLICDFHYNFNTQYKTNPQDPCLQDPIIALNKIDESIAYTVSGPRIISLNDLGRNKRYVDLIGKSPTVVEAYLRRYIRKYSGKGLIWKLMVAEDEKLNTNSRQGEKDFIEENLPRFLKELEELQIK